MLGWAIAPAAGKHPRVAPLAIGGPLTASGLWAWQISSSVISEL